MNITVIGAGNMGGALIHGWAKSGKLSSITISDKNEALLASFKKFQGEISFYQYNN